MPAQRKKISVLGLGYVGLTMATCFADRGWSVIGYDSDESRMNKVASGNISFYEQGLQELARTGVESGFLRFAKTTREAVLGTDITFIAVGTPARRDGFIDLQFVDKASAELGAMIGKKRSYHLVVVKSTVIPGTTLSLVKNNLEKTSSKTCGEHFGLCVNPEFLREGSAVNDTLKPDRLIIGEFDGEAGNNLLSLYREFYRNKLPPVLRMSLSSAEMVKYANNAFLALKVSLINEIANICQRLRGIDVKEVARGIGLDPRIAPRFLDAGVGFGGSCFPKDVSALVKFAESKGYCADLLACGLDLNEKQPDRCVDLVLDLMNSDVKGKTVAILGLAFKPGTSDMREAPSVRIITRLLKLGAFVKAYDPVANEEAMKIFGEKISYSRDIFSCLRDTDCCIIVTEWDKFRGLKPEDFLRLMRSPRLVDGRRIFDPRIFNGKLPFRAIGLGHA